jgi:large subunit ribosomal protein L21e
MVKRSRGPRSSTRHKLKKKPRNRGLSPITRTLVKFEVGDRASVVIDPSIHKGQPHPRFHGLTGVVTGKQGSAYTLDVKVGNKKKTLLVRSEHLKKLKSQPA